MVAYVSLADKIWPKYVGFWLRVIRVYSGMKKQNKTWLHIFFILFWNLYILFYIMVHVLNFCDIFNCFIVLVCENGVNFLVYFLSIFCQTLQHSKSYIFYKPCLQVGSKCFCYRDNVYFIIWSKQHCLFPKDFKKILFFLIMYFISRHFMKVPNLGQGIHVSWHVTKFWAWWPYDIFAYLILLYNKVS